MLAVNIDGAPEHPWIARSRRLSLAAPDADAVAGAVENHYRRSVVDQRRRRLAAVVAAPSTDRQPGLDGLANRPGVPVEVLAAARDGDVDEPAPWAYVVERLVEDWQA